MLSCTSERNPCCGPKIAASVTPGARREPIDDVAELASIEAGLQTTPTRWPRSGARLDQPVDSEAH